MSFRLPIPYTFRMNLNRSIFIVPNNCRAKFKYSMPTVLTQCLFIYLINAIYLSLQGLHQKVSYKNRLTMSKKIGQSPPGSKSQNTRRK